MESKEYFEKIMQDYNLCAPNIYEQEVKAVECLQYANFPHFSCMDKNIFISLPQESYIKKRLTMNTLTYDNQTQLIVTIDDMSLVKKISEAVRLIKGVSSVSISKPNHSVLESASYKAGLKDIENGNVTSYSNSDEMFQDLLK